MIHRSNSDVYISDFIWFLLFISANNFYERANYIQVLFFLRLYIIHNLGVEGFKLNSSL